MTDWNAVSFLRRSEPRRLVAVELSHHPATPSTLGDRTGVSLPHVSRALSELREEGFVELLVDEEVQKGRVYGLTDAGERLVEDHKAAGAV